MPEDSEYSAECRLWNAMFDRRPLALAQCTGVSDVVSAIRFAENYDLPFTVRGGGHSVDGKALADGALAIDLAQMNGVLTDPGSARAVVQAGCRWRIVDREAQLHGLGVTGGTVSDTGVAGLTLGGGIGWTMRKYGVTVDSVVAINGVAVTGDVVRASAEENPELFWGMRGAGANFMIATSFEFQLHSFGPVVLAGRVVHSGSDVSAAMRFWRDFMNDAPDELGSIAVLRQTPANSTSPGRMHQQPAVEFMVVHLGDVKQGEKNLQPLREWGTPHLDTVQPMTYTEAQQMIENSTPKRMRNYEKAGYISAVTDSFIEKLITGAAFSPIPSGTLDRAIVALWRMGGAIDRIPDEAMAFSRKDASYFWDIETMWRNPAEDERWSRWAADLAETLEKESMATSYVNRTVDDDTTFLGAAYGHDKFVRLVRLKNAWDPENLLCFNKNIPPSV